MEKTTVPEIETERFLQRQITEEDIEEWTRLNYADPEMMRYMPKSDMAPKERAEHAFGFIAGAWSRYGYRAWVITNKQYGQQFG
ncbi:MAG: GNAT family protein [Candidatus Promineifilaceae bacterium]|nr:GNAT family protein [Candidatus Promineifilaceae bacterium]